MLKANKLPANTRQGIVMINLSTAKQEESMAYTTKKNNRI